MKMKNKMLLGALIALVSICTSGAEISAKWFRMTFKEKISWDTGEANGFRFIEWELYDATTNQQSRGLTAVATNTVPSEMAAGTCLVLTPYTVTTSKVAKLFDGTKTGTDEFAITGIPKGAMSISDSSTWSTVIIRLRNDANPVTSYQMFAGRNNWNGSAGVIARWTLEASHDGVNWFVVDDHTSADVTRPSANNKPYNGGVPFQLSPLVLPVVSIDEDDASAYSDAYIDDALVEKTGVGTVTASDVRACRLSVAEGSFSVQPPQGESAMVFGTVTVSADAQLSVGGDAEVEKLVNRGTVSVAAGANLVSAPDDGETSFYRGGGISGSGGVRKTGDGTLEMDGANTYTGDTVVESGTLRVGWTHDRPARWFRLVLKAKYKVPGDASILDLGEFALYDTEGVQQNVGAKVVGSSTPARQMGPGTCKIESAYTSSGLAYLCDGTLPPTDGDWQCLSVTGLPVGADTYCAMSASKPETWITVTVRLRDDAAAVAGYNLYLPRRNYEGTIRCPSGWTLEASFNGEDWFTADDRTYVSSPGGNNRWYNGGVAFGLSAALPSGDGALPAGSALSVAPGALAVATNGVAALSRLRIDCEAGAGVIDGFGFAPSGVLILENDSALGVGVELPITLANITGTENLKSWTVWRGSTPATSTGVKLKDGKLVLYGKGFMIKFL